MVILTPSFLRISQNLNRLGFISALPPDMTTHLVPNCWNEANSPWMSDSVRTSLSLFPIQISHIIHRQLHPPCGMRIAIGKAYMRCVFRVKNLLKASTPNERGMAAISRTRPREATTHEKEALKWTETGWGLLPEEATISISIHKKMWGPSSTGPHEWKEEKRLNSPW